MAAGALQNFRYLGSLDVARATAELACRPDLWSAHPDRTAASGSPHAESQDIWVRYQSIDKAREPDGRALPHESEFYPAWTALPAFQPLVFDVMRLSLATRLGGILITRIPPGAGIAPHHDRGSWHAEYYDAKAYLILQANARCENRAEGEAVHMATGTVWWFDNQVVHSVHNGGDEDRIAAIICMRTT